VPARQPAVGNSDVASYETLFDATTVPFGYGGSAILLAISALVMWWGFRRVRQADYQFFADYRTARGTVWLLIGSVFAMGVGQQWWAHQTAQATIRQGDGTQQVEGVVQDHWIKDETRQSGSTMRRVRTEHFRIEQTEFHFVAGDFGPYFTNRQGLKLENGMRLRVSYRELEQRRRIVKLEVAR
jgi:hypothetical protein